MKLSIVIPLYNKEKYIERCINSLLEQDLPASEYEIIIIDDGSKDSGGAIAQKYAGNYSNIHFISQENAGPSAARNKGLAASKGDYVYFLDADDFLAANVLNNLLEIAEDNKLDILEFNTKEIMEGAMPNVARENHHDSNINVKDGITYIAEQGFRNEAWRYIISKDLLVDTGIKFIEGTLYEDVIFTASLFLKANRIAKVNLDVHRYVTVENSIVTSRDAAHNLRFIHGMVYAVEKMQGMIKDLDPLHVNYDKVKRNLKARQQAFVYALIIRTYKHRLLSVADLKKILDRLHSFEVYPIDTTIGIGIGGFIHNSFFVPFFNNETFLLLCIRIRRLIPVR